MHFPGAGDRGGSWWRRLDTPYRPATGLIAAALAIAGIFCAVTFFRAKAVRKLFSSSLDELGADSRGCGEAARRSVERRRQVLHARSRPSVQLRSNRIAFRAPLHAFEVARGVGERIRRHARLIGVAAACAAFLIMRGGTVSKTIRTLRLAYRTTRWMGLAKLALRLVQRRPLTSA
jgi:hypothetical protein